MFDFLKKKALPADFFQGACDVHCHILPGVDDGFKNAEDSIQALKFLEEKGVRKMKLTPHFMKEFGENTKDTIAPKFEEFKKKVAGQCNIELQLAAEHMLDSGFPEHFKRGFLSLDKDKSLVLCETSYMMCDPKYSSMLYDVMLEGFTPVIAHPERYQYASKQQYERWKEKDYLFQLNLLSLTGAYGGPAMEKSHYMLQHKMYDFVGSDMHRLDNFRKFMPNLKLKTDEIDELHLLLENNSRLF